MLLAIIVAVLVSCFQFAHEVVDVSELTRPEGVVQELTQVKPVVVCGSTQAHEVAPISGKFRTTIRQQQAYFRITPL